MSVRLLVALAVVAGCSDADSVYHCTADVQCRAPGRQGVCVAPDRLCAFPSAACASGLVFDASAGAHAGECVPLAELGAPDLAADFAPTDLAAADSSPSAPGDLAGADLAPPPDLAEGLLTWSLQTTPALTADLYAVWGSSASDVYAVGAGGTILHSTGNGSFTPQPSGVAADLFGVWGSGNGDVYAVGSSSTIIHSTGNGVWSASQLAGGDSLRAVWGSGAGDVYVSGLLGVIRHSVGGAPWTAQTSGVSPNDSYYALWGSGAGDVYAVGTGATLHSTGAGAWIAQPSGTTGTLTAVWGSGAADVYAAGTYGALVHSTGGGTWTAQPSGAVTGTTLQGGVSFGAGDVWAVGGVNGTPPAASFLHSTGNGSWSRQAVPTLAYWAIWGSGAGDIYAVAAHASILRGR